ncbi:MFS transporter [Pseudonocardia eucalypti]|uniref:MFS transporter n=1 Tax=Pseudonocardia eucalypti TaxID=648755 RepID=A0ABP9PTX6_9PSEU|nr:MFS family permease [Pseudonocardia eucalypti]
MALPDERHRRRALLALCTTEITSWGVLYYSFPVLLGPVTGATGWSAGATLSAFSAGLLVSAMCAVPVGRALDRYGPRPVMTTGSVLGTAALLGVAAAPALPWLFAACALVGVAQSMLLYPPAFAALTRWYGPARVRAITVLSLAGGLASTVFAPPTALLAEAVGWRWTFVALAAVLALLTGPLHLCFLRLPWTPAHRRERAEGGIKQVLRTRPFLLLVAALTLASFAFYGATLNLVPLLTGRGVDNTVAATMLGLVGAGQVLGRLGYPTLTRLTGAGGRTAAVLAVGALTTAALAAVTGPLVAVGAVALAAGATRGTYTLLQATAVSDRWGTAAYATLTGIAITPATAAMAVGPAGTALLAERLGSYPASFYLLTGLLLVAAGIALGTKVTLERGTR